ncbi:Sorting nexin mvp1 [Saitoella coloradoensis]
MSLFGDSARGGKTSLFGDDNDDITPKAASNSLFGTSNDDHDPWGLPVPKSRKRHDVGSLLNGVTLPHIYEEAFVAANPRPSGILPLSSLRQILDCSHLAPHVLNKILTLVLPDDSEIGRGEFVVAMALVGLAQEGEDVSLDGVDERRKDLPIPKLDLPKPTPPEPEAKPIPETAAGVSATSIPDRPTSARPPRTPAPIDNPEHNPFSSSLPNEPPVPPVAPAILQAPPLTSSESQHFVRPLSQPRQEQEEEHGEADPWGGNNPGASHDILGSHAAPPASTWTSTRGGDNMYTPSTSVSGAGGSIQIQTVPEKEGLPLFKHVNYTITHHQPATTSTTVTRRYSDFTWLLSTLTRRYPFRLIPLMPPKRLAVNGHYLSADAAFLERRRRGLKRFLEGVVGHPILGKDVLVGVFLSVPVEIGVWRKQASVTVQEEFDGIDTIPEGLVEGLPPNLDEVVERVRTALKVQGQTWIGMCTLLERLARRQEGFAMDLFRVSLSLGALVDDSSASICPTHNCQACPTTNRGLSLVSKHLQHAQGLLEDESRAWDDGVLEDLKRQRDKVVGMREMFERWEKGSGDDVAKLEKRIRTSEAKIAVLRLKEGKEGEITKLEQGIVQDKATISQFMNRRVMIRQCLLDEIVYFHKSQTHVGKLWQGFAAELVKYGELGAENWRRMDEGVQGVFLVDAGDFA